MRRTLVVLAACALVAPLAAQEPGTKSTTGNTVTQNTTTTTVRTGPMSRITRRGGDVIVVQGTMLPGTMTTTITVNGVTKTMTMEPVYNHRGRMMGYREVVSPTATKTETKPTTENPVTQTGNTEKVVEKTETKTTVTTPTTESMPQRRSVLSRIFRR